MQYIDIQYADGRNEGGDLAGRWDGVTEDTTGIEHAGYFVPKRGGGHRAQGVFGITRGEAAVLSRACGQERTQRAARAAKAMYVARDWTWSPPHQDRHL